MPRLIRIDATRPYKIEPKDFPPDGKSIWICACGLTRTPPFCDKSHKACDAEQAGTLYTYDAATKQLTGSQPDPSPPPSSAAPAPSSAPSPRPA
jgi:CDGSH-type Zn-finger protein